MLTKLAFAAAALIFTSTGFSQDLPKSKGGYKKKEFNLPSFDQPILLTDSALKRDQKLREAFLTRIREKSEGRFSHNSLNGKIMLMSPDNMPCLVPDMNQIVTMPNANPPGVPPAPMPVAKKRTSPPLNR